MANVVDYLKRLFWPALVLGLGVAISLWFVNSRPEASSKPQEETIWPVTVVAATRIDVQPDIAVFGQIRASREADIRAMVAGRLVTLNPEFKDGNLLLAGTELATIDPVDYENRLAEQRAELGQAAALLAEYQRELEWENRLQANAERQVELAERGLERSEQLQRSGRESKKARDDAEAALTTSQQNQMQRAQAIGRLGARVQQQQAAYARIQAALANAERELARTRVTAPFDGHVTDVKLALGKLVAVGESLGRLLSSSDLEVRFDLPEADFARLIASASTASADGASSVVGRAVKVVWRLGETEYRYDAHITRIGAEIDAALGGIEVMAQIESSAVHNGLRAGAFVEIHVPDQTYHDVYRLPMRALSADGNIYALRDGRLVQIEAVLVRDLGSEVLVQADLTPSDSVVTRTFAGIGPGLRARPL